MEKKKLLDTFQEEYQLFVRCLLVLFNSRVDGHQRYLDDLSQGGFEIPCILTFVANNHKEGKKGKQFIESTLSVEVCQELESESYQLQSTSSIVTTK